MFDGLKPDSVYGRITDISFKELNKAGYRFALLDFDNTLGPDRSREPDRYAFSAVKMIEDAGISCCLVSNAKTERAEGIAAKLGISCVAAARKPSADGVVRAMKMMGAEKENTFLVGDQLFTDIAAGKKAGLHTVLVEKYENKEIWYVKIKRPLEKAVRAIAGF